jgi:hypothetical protein
MPWKYALIFWIILLEDALPNPWQNIISSSWEDRMIDASSFVMVSDLENQVCS